MMLNGVPIDSAASYRGVLSDYLANSGDGLTVFKSGTNMQGRGVVDVGALVNYVKRMEQSRANRWTALRA